jgi:4-alpha-glucanotransferase
LKYKNKTGESMNEPKEEYINALKNTSTADLYALAQYIEMMDTASERVGGTVAIEINEMADDILNELNNRVEELLNKK